MYTKIPLSNIILFSSLAILFSFCTQNKAPGNNTQDREKITSSDDITFNGDTSKIGMVYIPGGQFMMGADNDQASKDEYPKHKVIVNAFWMDEHEVTRRFVYV